jgi:hypothetical protein
LARNLIVKSAMTLTGRQEARAKLEKNDQRERPVVSALLEEAAVAQRDRPSASLSASGRPKRSDTLIASAVLVALIAGWVMNFVSLKQLSLGFGLIAQAAARQI